MDHVRKDYFWYYREPIYEDGIQIRDMLMFRSDLVGGEQAQQRAGALKRARRR
jgi:hypothetical protein